MDDSILIELECPVCTNLLSPPIRQCATGHSVCSDCFVKLKKCSLCLREFTDSRNFTLESLSLKIKYPCENESYGCQQRLTYSEREDHHRNCRKGLKFSCAMEGCPFVGDPADLKAHWLSKRTIFRDVQKDVVHLINGQYKVDLIEAFNELFWFKRSFYDDNIYFAMQYIGNPTKAESFYFEVEFCEINTNRNKLTLSHMCSSTEISDDKLFSYSVYSSRVGFDSVHSYLAYKSNCDAQLVYTLKIFQIGHIAQPNLEKRIDEKERFHKRNSQAVKEKNPVAEKTERNLPDQSNKGGSVKVNSSEKKDSQLLIEL
ncbi:hypothetical protein WA026_023131 [Henosepilachna vigintioctopunctata]|uniref:E3 ubiquitin-protein ligase n=1 Tax=Henosepilachna vigintioctopunctata TaxID=420089 RepID=A0AAW1TS00_9CUCU